MPPIGSIRGACRTYRRGTTEVRALDGVDLIIARSDLVAIMGASGSGKATLLNVLGTLDRLDAGSYHLDGVAVESLDDETLSATRNPKLGFALQSFQLLPRYTALENVELPLIYAGVGRGLRHARARAAPDRVGLEDRVDHLATQLSGRQQQRVAIARAPVNTPRVLIADEPTGTLDSRTTQGSPALLGALHAQSQRKVLLETCLLTILAGALGVGLGMGGAWLASAALSAWSTEWPFRVVAWSIPAALGASLVAGVLAGWLPARRAPSIVPATCLAEG